MTFFKENQSDNSKKYLLVMEYADNGTLRKYLEGHFDNLTWNDKFNLALQLAYAVSCLHDEGIVQRDLVININLLSFISYTIIIIYFIYWLKNSTLAMYWFIKIPSN